MKKIVTAMALVALTFGASVAMARGPEVQNRAGAFAKGGTGVELREDSAAYRLTGDAAAPAKTTAATPAASCPKCKMVMETNELAGSHRTPATPVMHCDDCTNAVTNFLTKGEFKHTCATCGDKLEEMCKH